MVKGSYSGGRGTGWAKATALACMNPGEASLKGVVVPGVQYSSGRMFYCKTEGSGQTTGSTENCGLIVAAPSAAPCSDLAAVCVNKTTSTSTDAPALMYATDTDQYRSTSPHTQATLQTTLAKNAFRLLVARLEVCMLSGQDTNGMAYCWAPDDHRNVGGVDNDYISQQPEAVQIPLHNKWFGITQLASTEACENLMYATPGGYTVAGGATAVTADASVNLNISGWLGGVYPSMVIIIQPGNLSTVLKFRFRLHVIYELVGPAAGSGNAPNVARNIPRQPFFTKMLNYVHAKQQAMEDKSVGVGELSFMGIDGSSLVSAGVRARRISKGGRSTARYRPRKGGRRYIRRRVLPRFGAATGAYY